MLCRGLVFVALFVAVAALGSQCRAKVRAAIIPYANVMEKIRVREVASEKKIRALLKKGEFKEKGQICKYNAKKTCAPNCKAPNCEAEVQKRELVKRSLCKGGSSGCCRSCCGKYKNLSRPLKRVAAKAYRKLKCCPCNVTQVSKMLMRARGGVKGGVKGVVKGGVRGGGVKGSSSVFSRSSKTTGGSANSVFGKPSGGRSSKSSVFGGRSSKSTGRSSKSSVFGRSSKSTGRSSKSVFGRSSKSRGSSGGRSSKGRTFKGRTSKGRTFKSGRTSKGRTFKGRTSKGRTFKGRTSKGSTFKGVGGKGNVRLVIPFNGDPWKTFTASCPKPDMRKLSARACSIFYKKKIKNPRCSVASAETIRCATNVCKQWADKIKRIAALKGSLITWLKYVAKKSGVICSKVPPDSGTPGPGDKPTLPIGQGSRGTPTPPAESQCQKACSKDMKPVCYREGGNVLRYKNLCYARCDKKIPEAAYPCCRCDPNEAKCIEDKATGKKYKSVCWAKCAGVKTVSMKKCGNAPPIIIGDPNGEGAITPEKITDIIDSVTAPEISETCEQAICHAKQELFKCPCSWKATKECNPIGSTPSPPDPNCRAKCTQKERLPSCVYDLFTVQKYPNMCEAKCDGAQQPMPCTDDTPPPKTPSPKPTSVMQTAKCRAEVVADCMPRCAEFCQKEKTVTKVLIPAADNDVLRRQQKLLQNGACPRRIKQENLGYLVESSKNAVNQAAVYKDLAPCLYDCTKMCYMDPDLEVPSTRKEMEDFFKRPFIVKSMSKDKANAGYFEEDESESLLE